MKQTEYEIRKVKDQYTRMWYLVEKQVISSFASIENFDRDAAKAIVMREKMVNAQELAIDDACERFLALFAPVAVDLRFVISMIKINNNLERIGDFAEGLAKFCLNRQTKALSQELKESLRWRELTDTTIKMMQMARESFETENSEKALSLMDLDTIVDDIYNSSTDILADAIRSNPENTEELMTLQEVVRRVERMCDHFNNVAEEIVFYLDARELRHQS
ncbi:MAG: phosphate signaling complex protein PhoU [Bacteroidia bacterium]|nr:phosphate signaling complex protein PhoU [Bacteroidia bacterium]